MVKNKSIQKPFEKPSSETTPDVNTDSVDLKLSPEETQEKIVTDLLKLACDTSSLTGKSLKEKIDIILDLRVENEVMINKLLQVGTVHDQIAVESAAQINNRNKDSISDLIRVKQLLAGLPTERISVEDDENQFRFDRLKDMGRGVN